MQIYGLVGIVHICNYSFLVVISRAETVIRVLDIEILEIEEVQVIPFSAEVVRDEIARYVASLTKVRFTQLLTNGFFFSYHYDLTNSLERNKQPRPNGTLHDLADLRFYWNRDLYKDLLAQEVDRRFCLPVVQGCVAMATAQHCDLDLTLILISRRSCHRAGTRYNARGVDEDGNVGNFVETEQVVFIKGTLYSFLQTRGSAPVFWKQSGITAQVALSKSKEVTNEAFLKHIRASVELYGHVTIVNLLDIDKPHERLLTESMEALLSQHRADMENHIGYLYFNFNKMCKGERFQALSQLLEQLGPLLDYYQFFALRQGETLLTQRGVTRINCLDSLDRTNVVMSRIAWKVMSKQIEHAGSTVQVEYESSTAFNDLLRAFKNMWADTGDMLSHQYTGTGSTISSVTRNGKQGLKGLFEQGMKSVRRFYEAHVEDGLKQEVIELLLGRHQLSIGRSLTSRLERLTLDREAEFTQYHDLVMRAGCWNVNGKSPSDIGDLTSWLLSADDSIPPQLIVVGLQDLIVRKCRTTPQPCSRELVLAWTDLILSTLNTSRSDTFVVVRTEEMCGTYIAVFAQETLMEHISGVESDKVKLNEEGRGGVILHLSIYDSTICFWNVSLQRCHDKLSQRLSQLLEIEKLAFQQLAQRPKLAVEQHDFKVLMGDLNFRIEMSQNEVMQCIQNGDAKSLLEFDQLVLAQKHAHAVLSKYSESPFDFLPTYRYSDGGSDYEGDAPAWCSRILYQGQAIGCHEYRRSEIRSTKQRPVFCTFELLIKEINETRLKEVQSEMVPQVPRPME